MTATIIPFNDSRLGVVIQFKVRARAIRDAAQQGWVLLSDDEKDLIRLLRHTSHSGRDAVLDAARAVRKKQPLVERLSFGR